MRVDRLLSRVPVWGWFLLAAAVRAAFVLKLGGRLYQIDEGGLDWASWRWAETLHAGAPVIDGIWPPVPTTIFGMAFAAFGHVLAAPRLVQALVSAGTAVVIGRMTEDLSGSPRAGRLALALASIYPFFVYYSGLLLSETLYIAFLTPGLWRLASSLRRPDRASDAARAGLLLALAALCRTEAAPITLVLLILGALAAALVRWSWKAWTLAVLCWALPLAGWAARNRARYGSFTLDEHGGLTLLHGTLVFDVNEKLDTGDAMKALEAMPFYQEAQSLPSVERDRVYRRAAFRFMREHPVEVLGQWARKFVSFWRFYPRVDKSYAETGTSRPDVGLSRWVLVAVSLAFEPWIILLGWVGLWARRREPWTWPLALFMLGSMGIHMIVVSQMRYRLPVMPILILGACSWIAARVDKNERKS